MSFCMTHWSFVSVKKVSEMERLKESLPLYHKSLLLVLIPATLSAICYYFEVPIMVERKQEWDGSFRGFYLMLPTVIAVTLCGGVQG